MYNDNGGGDFSNTRMMSSSSPLKSVPIESQPSTAVGVGVDGGLNYILHPVSKFDTLAGVAIKYGVEVADIKKLNGLVTDLQMFALKTLQIPLPGRHPPSPSLSDGHDIAQRPSSSDHSDFLGSFHSLKLKSSSDRNVLQGLEMSLYPKSPPINPPLSHHRKSKSVTNCLLSENGYLIDEYLSQETGDTDASNKWVPKVVRRRQKSEANFTFCTPEKLLKEENSSGSAISAITGKGLALRPKSGSRTGESNGSGPFPSNLGDSFVSENVNNGVRKSLSTSSLQDSENGNMSSIWPSSKWSLKPDFQTLSTAAITRPIFDGLPKPVGRKNKAALD